MKKILSLKIFLAALLIAALVSPEADAATKRKKYRRRHPIETTEARTQKGALSQPRVSDAVIEALGNGDLDGAIIALREEKPSPKTLYLTREVSRITSFDANPKPEKKDAHKIYQNVAIAYHNLYLFLKTEDIEQDDFFKEALKYYDRARTSSKPSHRSDGLLLKAAIIASNGGIKKAEKIFSKVNTSKFKDDFESMEYMAAYYAATGDVDKALSALEDAYRLNPESTLTWLVVGDDFYAIKDDPLFQKFLIQWKAAEAEKKLALTIPKEMKAQEKKIRSREKSSDKTQTFSPQKNMPRYNIKKKHKTKSSKK